MFRAQVSSIRSPTTASVNLTKSGMVFRILNASVVGCGGCAKGIKCLRVN